MTRQRHAPVHRSMLGASGTLGMQGIGPGADGPKRTEAQPVDVFTAFLPSNG